MLNNEKLVRRLKKIFKYLKERWGITPYRIALETKIPHASLKYMMDEKFEWKLNHLLAIVDFLNRNNAMISISDLLDFNTKKSMSDIMNDEKADFRKVLYGEKAIYKKLLLSGEIAAEKVPEVKPVDSKKESEELAKDLHEVIKESRLFKNHKISLDLKINGKNFDFQKDMKFVDGKKLKV